jgi:hypothetical protein
MGSSFYSSPPPSVCFTQQGNPHHVFSHCPLSRPILSHLQLLSLARFLLLFGANLISLIHNG